MVKSLRITHFIDEHLCFQQKRTEDTDYSVFAVQKSLKTIEATKLDFHLIILCVEGSCDVSVGHHDFVIRSSTISIVPPNTVFSTRYSSADFNAYLLLFNSDFVKKGFVKSEIMEELLFISPDYAPIFDLNENDFDDVLYKFKKIKEEADNQSPFCIEVSQLYIIQLLYSYNRICEICLLNSDKLINRQYQVMYQFRKLVDTNFRQLKSVKEYADMMFLSPKYISECVKNQTGVSALIIIQNRIILEAEFLLTYSQHTIKSIAAKLGFPSTSAFSRFFKGVNGMSPDHYRNKREN